MEFINVKRKHRSPDEWYALVKQWRDSPDNQKTFCEAHGLVAKTFSRWVSNYREMFDSTFTEDDLAIAPTTGPTFSPPGSPVQKAPSSEPAIEINTTWMSMRIPTNIPEEKLMQLLSYMREAR